LSITTIDHIAAGLAVAQRQNVIKVFGAAKVAGAFQSAWKAAGRPGAGSDAPAYTVGSGYTCSSATAGSLAYVNGAVQNYLARMSASTSVACSLIIADRLWSCSGMGFAASTYTVTTPGALPARITDGGVGCELWVENFVAAGSASGTLTANYLNQAGDAKAGVIAAVTSAPVAGQMQPVPLQVGDTGISQLTSAVNSATWTSGSWGMTILKRIATIELPIVGVAGVQDWSLLGIPPIPADACLMFMLHASTTTAATVLGSVDIIDK
jgi:hypothetical protein